jgi:hypothetical protein
MVLPQKNEIKGEVIMEGLAKRAALYSKALSLPWHDIPWPTAAHGVEDLNHYQVGMDRSIYLMRKRFGKQDASMGSPEAWSDHYKEQRPKMIQNDMNKITKNYLQYGKSRPLGEIHPMHHLDDTSPFGKK